MSFTGTSKRIFRYEYEIDESKKLREDVLKKWYRSFPKESEVSTQDIRKVIKFIDSLGPAYLRKFNGKGLPPFSIQRPPKELGCNCVGRMATAYILDRKFENQNTFILSIQYEGEKLKDEQKNSKRTDLNIDGHLAYDVLNKDGTRLGGSGKMSGKNVTTESHKSPILPAIYALQKAKAYSVTDNIEKVVEFLENAIRSYESYEEVTGNSSPYIEENIEWIKNAVENE